MKNLLLSLLLLSFTAPVFAQYSSRTLLEVPNSYTLRKHEFRLSVGAYPTIPTPFDNYGWVERSMNNEFQATKEFLGSTFTHGGYTASYAYRLRKWIDFGVGVTFANEYFNTYSNLNTNRQNRYSTDAVSIVPTVRFSWLNREWVRLYSSVGVGITFISSNRKDIDLSPMGNGQIIPIGISVGRSLFGFAEVGYGAQGALIIGIGYSFNGQKAQR